MQSTQPPPARPGRLIDRFHYVMGVAWLAIWWSNLLGVLFSYHYAPINPYYSLVAIYLPYFLFSRSRQMLAVAARPLFWGWLATAVVAVLLYWASDRSTEGYDSMRARIVVFSGIAGSMVILLGNEPLKLLRSAAKIILATSVLLNLVEVVVPLFSTAPGRSAGFFQNPNVAAAGIIICVIVLLDFRRHTGRNMLVLALGFVGVVTTFSRSGMLFLALLWVVYTLLPRGQGGSHVANRLIVMVALGLVVLGALLTAWQFGAISEVGEQQIDTIIEMREDASAHKRRMAAINAWRLFTHHPFTGLGIGAPEHFVLSTHNTYLHLATEFGILGLLFFLVLAFGPAVKVLRWGLARSTTHVIVLAFVFYYGAFDHYIHSHGVFTVLFAALAVDTLIDREPRPSAQGVGVRDRIDWRGAPAPAGPAIGTSESSPG